LTKPATPATRAQAIALFERALSLDPQSVTAQSWLARTLAARESDQLTAAPTADVARAEAVVRRALIAEPRDALAHYAQGTVLRAQDRFEEAIPEYELAIEFDRNWLDAYANLAQCKFYAGSLEEYIPLVEQAIRLSPRDPMIGCGSDGLAWRTCCNRILTRQSTGSKRHAAPVQHCPTFMLASPQPWPLKATPSAPESNLPEPAA
jgi:tetratricopeptide (TPR) repeat protein